jgi:hypothetical protein
MTAMSIESQLREPLNATLAWLRGDIPQTPHHFGPPMPETRALIPVLTKAVEAGLLTVNSQPSMDEPDCRQRATLSAVAGQALAEHIAEQLSAAGLIADTWPLATTPPGRGPICVSTWPGGTTRALVPAGLRLQACPDSPVELTVADDPEAAESFRQAHLGSWPDHRAVLLQCWALEVVDPAWTTTARLWTGLNSAIDDWRRL